MKLTVIVLTKNEEDVIERCIKSVKFADEVIIIDDYSSDKTSEIATNLGAKVYKRKLSGDYASQRNFGLKKATNEWVLFVDADELVSDDLGREISNFKSQKSSYNGYFIRRRDVLWGSQLKYGESGSIKILRLGRKDAGMFKRKVHEHWDIKGKVGEMKGILIHFPHKDLREFIRKISGYSRIHTSENEREGKSSSVLKIIFYPQGKFIYNYFYKLAILDGVRGFVASILMSFHSFVSWSSLWMSDKKDL